MTKLANRLDKQIAECQYLTRVALKTGSFQTFFSAVVCEFFKQLSSTENNFFLTNPLGLNVGVLSDWHMLFSFPSVSKIIKQKRPGGGGDCELNQRFGSCSSQYCGR